MKGNSESVSSMDRECKNLQMEIFTKETMRMANLLDLVSIFGKMEVTLKECLRTD